MTNWSWQRHLRCYPNLAILDMIQTPSEYTSPVFRSPLIKCSINIRNNLTFLDPYLNLSCFFFSFTFWSENASASDPRTLFSSLSTMWSHRPPQPWAASTRSTTKRTSSSTLLTLTRACTDHHKLWRWRKKQTFAP